MRLLVAIIALAATGCSATVDEPIDDGEAVGPTDATVQGTVVIESTTVLPTTPSRVRSHVSARFLRVSGLDAQSADEVVGEGTAVANAPTGCSFREPDAAAVPDEGTIELLDVGDIVVHALRSDSPDVSLPLAARAFPDVGELISGVVYTSRDESTPLPEASTYVIETTGSPAVEGFSVQLDAPAAPEGVRLGGVDLEQPEGALLVGGESLGVSWVAGDDETDRIVVELEPLDPSVDGAAAVSCVFTDQGQAIVPAAYTSFVEGSEVLVVVRRYRRRGVKLPTVDEAYVDFDFAVTARVVVGG
jgi:hypothetical protein